MRARKSATAIHIQLLANSDRYLIMSMSSAGGVGFLGVSMFKIYDVLGYLFKGDGRC